VVTYSWPLLDPDQSVFDLFDVLNWRFHGIVMCGDVHVSDPLAVCEVIASFGKTSEKYMGL
jgi:hypothetical protein